MKKVLLITHGTLCEGYRSAVDVIGGLGNSFDTMTLHDSETLSTMMDNVTAYLEGCHEDDQIILCTDMAVGTTTKAAIPAVMKKACYLITGINLPMLLEILLKEFSTDIQQELHELAEAGRQAVLFMNEVIEQEVELC